MSIGDNLREIRLKRGRTLEDVANYVGTTPQTIYRYENGVIQNIPMKKIRKICEYLDVHPSSVLGLEDQEEESHIAYPSISEQLMLEDYRKLSVKTREAVDQLVHALSLAAADEEFEEIRL